MKQTAETMRLDKFLSNMGVGSRREVQSAIRYRTVTVNGEGALSGKMHVHPYTDTIAVKGTVIPYVPFVYIMLNKPAGTVSATRDNRHPTVVSLLEGTYDAYDVFPVGRLDVDTEGLLLLTNDGDLAHALLSPKKHVDKVYEAHLSAPLTPEGIARMESGMILDDGMQCLPARVESCPLDVEKADLLKAHCVRITLFEGKFHQVKRMVQSAGAEVLYLKRLSMGPLELDPALAPGQWRPLSDVECDWLLGLQDVDETK